MPRQRRLAFGLYLTVALGFAAMALVYLFSPRFMPYHAQVVGAEWEAVPLAYQRLLIAFQRGSGAAALACALALAILVLLPFRRGERWARWAIPAVGLTGSVPLAIVIWRLGAATGASVPLLPMLGAIGLLGAGWFVSLRQDG